MFKTFYELQQSLKWLSENTNLFSQKNSNSPSSKTPRATPWGNAATTAKLGHLACTKFTIKDVF